MFIYLSLLVLISSAGWSSSQSSPSSDSANFNLQHGAMPFNFGSASNDFGTPGFGPLGTIHSGTSTYSNSPSSARSFSGSVRTREQVFSERGGYGGYDAVGRGGTIGDAAPSTNYARSGSLGFGTGTFGHASGLGNGRLNNANAVMLSSSGGLTQLGNGMEHGHSRFVTSFGSGLSGEGGPHVANGGNGARSSTSFVHRSNFEKYTEIGGVGNSDLGSGRLELSKVSGPRIGSNSLRSVANAFGSVGNSRNNLESTVYPSENVDRGTRFGTGINGARNSLSLKSGSMVRTTNGGLFGSEPSTKGVGFGSGASSNVSRTSIVSETRGSHSGRSKDYGRSGRLSDTGTSEAGSGLEGAGKQLRFFESVSRSRSGSFSESGRNIGANDFGGLIGSGTGIASDEFGSHDGAVNNLHVNREKGVGVGAVGGNVVISDGGEGEGGLRLLERGKVLSSGPTGPEIIISQSSTHSLKSSKARLVPTSGTSTSDFDDGIKGLEVKGTVGRNKEFIRSSTTYTLGGSELKRSFGSGHMGLTPDGSFSSLESSDNSGFVSASSKAEKFSKSPGEGLVSEEVSGGTDSDSESRLEGLRIPENVNSLGGNGGSSTGTVGDSGFENTRGVESGDIKSHIRLSSSASGSHTHSVIGLEDSDESVSNFGSPSVGNKNPNGIIVSRSSARGRSDVGGNSGSGTGGGVRDIDKRSEGDFTGSEGGIGKIFGISSRGSKSGPGSTTSGGSAGTSEAASGSEEISASVHRPTSNLRGGFNGSGGTTKSGLRGPAASFGHIYVVRESSSLQSGFDGEGGSSIPSHYGSGGTKDGSKAGNDGGTTISLGGFGGGSGPEGTPGSGGNSVSIADVNKLRDISSDFRDGSDDNNSRSGTFGGPEGGLGDSVLSGSRRDTGNAYGSGSYIVSGSGSSSFDSYAGSSGKSGHNYGFIDGGKHRGNIFGTESKRKTTSDSDITEGSAITRSGFSSNYEASDLGEINDHKNIFGSGDKKSHSLAFGSSAGNSYGLDRSDGGKKVSVSIFGDDSNTERGSTNGDFGDSSSSPFLSNYANSGLNGISGSQNIFRTSYVASVTHSKTIGSSSGSATGLLSNPELGTSGLVHKNDTESSFGRGSDIHVGSNSSDFESSIGRTSYLGSYGLQGNGFSGIRGTRSDVAQSQGQSGLDSDTSASSAESLTGGSGCGGAYGYDQVGRGCVEGNIGIRDEHQWKTANFAKERSTGEAVNSEDVGEDKSVDVHTTGDSAFVVGLEENTNSGRTNSFNTGTGTPGIVGENKERASAIGDIYETSKLRSGSSSSVVGGSVRGGFSGIRGTDSGGSSAQGGSVHGGEVRGPLAGNIPGNEFSSNANNFRSVGGYIRYVGGLRELGEIAALRGTGESDVNVRGDHSSSSLGVLSNGGADGIFGEINPYSIRRNMVQRSSSRSSLGGTTSAEGDARGEPAESEISNGSKNGFVVSHFWSSGGIPDCGSGLDGTDGTSNSGMRP
ncbi:hypothetical protein B7P43_G05313 [Cryptotermes secundus]|uniref:Fibroin heavy chain-like n=1 Tax=Cryptotermes secundus TaxID=105785 RepID=A0A2J7QFA1_9NEOP|nr:hypothetical protein B7P43_G05313 [Cryptotermes secundus]